MTGWAKYLQGISEKNLCDCVEAPDKDPQDATKQRVQVIWATMEQVARKSQRTVQQCGQAIQVEAVRSEKGQTLHWLLLAYMDKAAIQKHQQLWQLAGQAQHRPNPMELKTDDPQMEAWTMTNIEKACLEFCIELLNQRHRSHEYKSALIIQTWERKDRSVEWVLASADNTLGDIDEGYNSDDAIEPRSSPPTSSIHSDDPLPAVDMHQSGRQPFQKQANPAPAEADADAEDGMDIEQWMGYIVDLQAAHSLHVAGMVYGQGIQEQAGTTAHQREMFRLSSTDWHQFLGFGVPAPPSTLGKRKRALWEDEAECMTRQPTMRFRGVQDPAIRAIQRGESPVIVVMLTGGGKSMLFMMPVFTAPGGTTVVVVLLVALQADMQRRCQQLGISCVAWESRRPPDAASIVLVTPESAVSPDFQTFLNRLRWMRRLDRIVIDECHVVLNSQGDFRPQMA
ncbi:hypothetical protein KXV37_002714 [Aspergillus fumigatus]|nr:hypothetical protein KXV37_002714 [Aspergillus fumigatus]